MGGDEEDNSSAKVEACIKSETEEPEFAANDEDMSLVGAPKGARGRKD